MYTKDVEFIIDRLEQNGYEGYIVGGCVRDSLLGLVPKDYDICTDALPNEVKQCFLGFNVIDTGLKHGTVTVVLNATPYEITTYRTDGEYLDNRRPTNVTFVRNIKEDLMRRDFTVNAMAYNQKVGVVDLFDGKKHLEQKLISAVLDPDTRFKEDGLRIIRGLRFASVYGFDIEQATSESMLKNKQLLNNISQERLNSELCKLLVGNNVEKILTDYRETFSVIIPPIFEMFDFEQHNPHHIYDVYTHTVKAVSYSAPIKEVRLALLFHDIGKPATFTQDQNGTGHFYRHAQQSEQLARTCLNKLKFDNKTKIAVLKLVKYHDANIIPDLKSVKRWLNKLGQQDFELLLEVKKADVLAQSEKELGARLHELQKLKQLIRQIETEKLCFNLKSLAVSGNDLIEIGVPKGREIGEVLQQVLKNVIDGNLKNDKQEILSFVKDMTK